MKKLYLFTVTLALLVMSGLLTSTAYAQDKQPNIVVIMGDDIGKWNIGACHHGMMAGRTPNIDKLAAKGAIFADYCAEVSCTADRASFITGEVTVHISLTTVEQAGAKIGCQIQHLLLPLFLKTSNSIPTAAFPASEGPFLSSIL